MTPEIDPPVHPGVLLFVAAAAMVDLILVACGLVWIGERL